MRRDFTLMGYMLGLFLTAISVFLPWFVWRHTTVSAPAIDSVYGYFILAMAVLGFVFCFLGPTEALADESRAGTVSRVLMGFVGVFIVGLALKQIYRGAPSVGNPHLAIYGAGFYMAVVGGLLCAVFGFDMDWAGSTNVTRWSHTPQQTREAMMGEPERPMTADAFTNAGLFEARPAAEPLVPPIARVEVVQESPLVEEEPAPADVIVDQPIDPVEASLNGLSYAEFAARRAMFAARKEEEAIIAAVRKTFVTLRQSLAEGKLSAKDYETAVRNLHAAIDQQRNHIQPSNNHHGLQAAWSSLRKSWNGNRERVVL